MADSPESIADGALQKIEQYFKLGAAVSERVALLNFQKLMQETQNNSLNSNGNLVKDSSR